MKFALSPVRLRRTLLALVCTAGCLASSVSVAVAEGYQGTETPPSSESTQTAVRGCGAGEQQLPLTALAPRQEHIGKTTDTHPTFVWYMPDADPFPMEFQLSEMTAGGGFQPVASAQLQSTPGFMHFSLPKTEPGLEIGKRYVWQVIAFCDPDDLAAVSVSRAEIAVVAPPSNLGQSADPVEQSALFAQAGLWYDAFRLVAVAPTDGRAIAQRSALLKELAAIEATAETPKENSNLPPYSELLQQIAAMSE